jgi:hypothetical protein
MLMTSIYVCSASTDVSLENKSAVQALRDELFDTLCEHEHLTISTDSEAIRRVGRLMLVFPLLTHAVLLARQYWLGVKLSGHATDNKLLSEMVERMLIVTETVAMPDNLGVIFTT